jgi:hypothetical protein
MQKTSNSSGKLPPITMSEKKISDTIHVEYTAEDHGGGGGETPQHQRNHDSSIQGNNSK